MVADLAWNTRPPWRGMGGRNQWNVQLMRSGEYARLGVQDAGAAAGMTGIVGGFEMPAQGVV